MPFGFAITIGYLAYAILIIFHKSAAEHITRQNKPIPVNLASLENTLGTLRHLNFPQQSSSNQLAKLLSQFSRA